MKIVLGIAAMTGLLAATPAMADCKNLPEPVAAYLHANPGWHLRVLEDFDADFTQKDWRKHNKDACPGMAVVDMDGKGRSYALLLERPSGKKPLQGFAVKRQDLVVVGRRSGGLWHLPLNSVETTVPMFVVRIKPGRTENAYHKTILLAHDGVVAGSWAAWSTLYYLRRGAVKKMLYTD